MIINKVDESYLQITDIDYADAKFLSDQFAFFAENYRFHPKYKMRKWDGKIRLYNKFNSTLPVGCYSRLIKLLDAANFRYNVTFDADEEKLRLDELKSYISDDLKSDLVPREYQLASIMGLINRNRGVGVLPTASGKSFVQYCIINYLLDKGLAEKTLLIVPTVALVNQMEYDFLDYAHDPNSYKENLHKIYSGMDKNTDKPITISTWQSLKELEPDYFEQFDLVMVDECHEATAKVLSNLVSSCKNAKYKFGVSGTLEDSKVHEMQLEALFGDIEHYKTTSELIEEGHLTPINIYNIVFKYSKEKKKQFNSLINDIKKKNKNTKEGIGAKTYQAENDFIANDKERKRAILKTINNCKGNTLVLFKNVSYGKELFELSKKYLDRNVYFVYGNITPDERERIRLTIEDEEDAIIFATLKIFSTGINIRKLAYLMFCQNIKSKIKVIQSIGRTLRKHDSKETARLIDIIDDLNGKNFSIKHAQSKLELYDREGHPYKVKEIDLK